MRITLQSLKNYLLKIHIRTCGLRFANDLVRMFVSPGSAQIQKEVL